MNLVICLGRILGAKAGLHIWLNRTEGLFGNLKTPGGGSNGGGWPQVESCLLLDVTLTRGGGSHKAPNRVMRFMNSHLMKWMIWLAPQGFKKCSLEAFFFSIMF